MAELESPLRDHLQDGCDEADLQRVWRKLQSRPQARSSAQRSIRWAVALAACLVFGVMAWMLVRRPAELAGPLKTAAGSDPSMISARPGAPEEVFLSDGSRIDLRAESRIEVLENDGRTFHTVLRQGAGTFDVRPGGPRKWTVECGGLTVEVVGTRFSVQRDAGRVRVAVEHGTVVLRGAGIPDGVMRLGAGQSVEAGIDESTTPRPEPSASCAPQPDPGPAVSGAQRTLPADRASDSQPMPSSNPAAAQARVDEIDGWMRDADQARKLGDTGKAAELLRRAISAAPRGDPRRAVASFALAQVELERNPSVAAETLQSALDAGVPSGMQEDSLARLVQAHARAGQWDKARAAASEYERRFPNGSRLGEVRQWATGKP